MTPTLRAGVLVATLALALSACGGQEADDTAPEAPLLPPHERADLADVFDPLVLPLGYRITRASLIDRTTYEVTPDGTHLALYVAPLSGISDDQFAADFPLIVTTMLPQVFDRWHGLLSFDICQEPFASPEQTPPSLTLIDLDRPAAESIQWEGMDLASLIAAADATEGLTVWARTEVRETPTWSSAAGA